IKSDHILPRSFGSGGAEGDMLNPKDVERPFNRQDDWQSEAQDNGGQLTDKPNNDEEQSVLDEKSLGEDIEQPRKRKSQADILIEMALESGAELFHTPVDDSYISFDVNDHRETWPVRSKATRQWLTRGFYRVTQKAPNSEAMKTALNLLEAKARFDGKRHDVHLRTAWQGGSLFYDLCDERWRAVQISIAGWRIVERAPAKFIRYRHMSAQVLPAPGGNLDDLFEFINVKSETDRKLLRAWNIVG